MKHLRQYIKRILLNEAANQPDDLPRGWSVKIIHSSGYAVVVLEDHSGLSKRTHGRVAFGIDPRRNGPCLDAYEVVNARAESGWGPMLYDIAMETAGSNGLMADRRSVSDDAYNVWKFYLNSRPDVQPKQLDIHVPTRFKGTITPDDESDDCVQDKYFNQYFFQQARTNPGDLADHGKALTFDEKDYLASPITKAFVKKGTPTINRLEELGLLFREDA